MSDVPNRVGRRNVFLFLVSALLALGGAEVVVRILGYSPWKPATSVRLTLESPEPFFREDPTTGFALRASHATIGVNDLFFSTSHDSLLLADSSHMLFRFTNASRPSRDSNHVWLLGGSYTYGWGVDDDETFASILENSADARVLNFAVPGYGTLHSLLQLNQLLETSSTQPVLVLFAHAPFHAERNVRARHWRKTLSAYNSLGEISLPVVETEDVNQLQYEPLDYTPFPLSKIFALANATDDAINRITYNPALANEVVTNLISEMAEVCRENGVSFAVINLVADETSPELFSTFGDKNIPFVDATVDLRIVENTLLPDDSHPSALAHQQYAELAADSVVSWLGR